MDDDHIFILVYRPAVLKLQPVPPFRPLAAVTRNPRIIIRN